MKAYGGSRSIDPHFLDPRHWLQVSGQFQAPAALPPGDTRLGGPQSWSGLRGEEKIYDPNGTRTPILRSSSP
jgi:hypothetical protein